MKKDIFNLENINDLPVDIKKRINNRKSFSKETEALLRLFDIKATLTITEIMVGLFRKNKIEKNRNWIGSTAYNLTRKGLLKKVSIGTYKKVD